MDFTIIILLVIIIIIVGVLLYIILVYNNLVKARNKVENAWSQIDVQLNRRADLIPNLVQTVKGYADHESEVFERVAEARSALLNANTVAEKSEANNILTNALKSLFAVAEAYPDLKANENFISLQDQLTTTENKIAYSRQFYNDVVLMYNNSCQMFPGNLIANMFNFNEKEYFKVPEEAREVPKVEF